MFSSVTASINLEKIYNLFLLYIIVLHTFISNRHVGIAIREAHVEDVLTSTLQSKLSNCGNDTSCD